jgi:hypothetical protein
VRFVAASLGLHAFFSFVLPRFYPVNADAPVAAVVPTEVDIEVEAPPAPAARTEITPPVPEPAPEAPAAAVENAAPHAEAPARAPSGDPAAAQEPPTAVGEPAPQGTAAPLPPGEYTTEDQGHVVRALPGIDGPKVWALPGVVAPGHTTAAPTTIAAPRGPDKDIGTRVVREAMKEADKKKGIDIPAAGTVATGVRDSVRSSDTPMASSGSFEVRVGPGGVVLGVRVVGHHGGTDDQWERAAQAALARLRGKTLALPDEYSRGALVYIDTTSTEELPSGSGSLIKQSGAGIAGDLSDIGAHKQRVVRSGYRITPAK